MAAASVASASDERGEPFRAIQFVPSVISTSPAGDVVVLAGNSSEVTSQQVVAFVAAETGEILEQLHLEVPRLWSLQLCPGYGLLICGHFGVPVTGTEYVVSAIELRSLQCKYSLLPVSGHRSYYGWVAVQQALGAPPLAAVSNGSVSTGDSTVILFHPDTGQVLHQLPSAVDLSPLVMCSFSPDGRFLIAAGVDHLQVHRCDAASGGSYPLICVLDGRTPQLPDAPAMCLVCECAAPCTVYTLEGVTQSRSFTVDLRPCAYPTTSSVAAASAMAARADSEAARIPPPQILERPRAAAPIVLLAPHRSGALILETISGTVQSAPEAQLPPGIALAAFCALDRVLVVRRSGAACELAVVRLQGPAAAQIRQCDAAQSLQEAGALDRDGVLCGRAAEVPWRRVFRQTRNQIMGHALSLRQ